jgi:hypothetical protein
MATPTPTPEPSEAERRQQELAAFEQTYNERIDSTLDRDVQDTYLLATGYRENEDGELVLWAVHWECRNLQAINDQQANLAANYAITVGQHDGAMPDRLQVVGVSDFEPLPGEAFPVEMEDAKAVQSGEIDEAEYLKRWALEEHAPSAKENETAYNMVVDEQNEALADKAWHDDADAPGGCPGPANDHPNNARDEG